MSALPIPGMMGGLPARFAGDPRYAGRLQMAQALMRGGADTSPVQSPWQGVARLGQALVGGYMANKVSSDAEAREKEYASTLAQALQAGQGAPAGLDPKTGITWETARAGNPQMMAQLLAGNPDTAPVALQMQMADLQGQAQLQRALAVEREKGKLEPPKTREIKVDGKVVTQEFNPETRQWTNLGSSPQWQPRLLTPEEVNQRKEIAGAGKTEVKVENVGNIPPGYQLNRGADGSLSMVPIPGSPVAEAKGKQDLRKEQTGSVVIQDIDRAMKLIDDATLPATGFGANVFSRIGGTAANDVRALLDSVKANAGFKELQAMREASPTGGALGSITERELALLQATIGSLEQSQTKEQLQDNMRRVKNVYLDIIHGKGNGGSREKLMFEEGQKGLQPGHIEDNYRYKGGDPGRRESWEPVS
jgi:hypothetical protein